MKTANLLVFVLAISLILSSCARPITDSPEKIVSPQNQLMSIRGTWEISKILMLVSSNEDGNKEQWIGNQVQFSNSYMTLGDIMLENPQYQMKRVSAEEYLLFNSKSLPEDFVLPNKEVEVITVIDQDKFFCEVLIIKEDELILKMQGNSFYLSKASNKVDDYIYSEIDDEKNQEFNILMNEENLIRTGVLIGLRSPNENDGNKSEGEYNYRTLWISSTNNEVNSVLEIDNIFFPRRSGFWKIEMQKATEDNRSEEYISANNVLMEDNKAEIQLKNKVMRSEGLSVPDQDITSELDFSRWRDRIGKVTRKINYVGNDYISIETIGRGEYIVGSETWEKSKLQILPIDGLPNVNGIKISDILEEAGVISMKSAWERTTNNFAIDSPNILYREELLENFGVERKLGHWFLKGRINYIKDKEFNTADYSIGLIPPSEVVVYDTLFVPWTNIKDRVPRALDAYTSPNKDIAIILTKRELLIYDINDNDLSNYPRDRVDIKQGETIIMAEWATGQYVESWETIFQKSGGGLLKY